MPPSSDIAAPVAQLERDHPISSFADRLTVAWERGWQPLDLARVLGTDHRIAAAVFRDALTLDRTRWHPKAAPVWGDQAAAIRASAEPWWNTGRPYWPQFLSRHGCSVLDAQAAAGALGFLSADMPVQPRFEPPPTQPGRTPEGRTTDDGVLAKIRALLAKAESSTFDEEAEALSAKAQELIARHSIDLALLAHEVDVPGGRRLYLERPYTKAKFVLLSSIADANNCRSVWNAQRETATLIGHQTDMQLSEMLFTSLLLQGTASVIEAGTHHDVFGRNSTKSWRNAFWYGFAHRVSERLRSATASARDEAVATTGRDLLPVLASRADAVADAFEQAFPELSTIDISFSNGDGLRAGRSAADRAELSADRSVGGKRRALGA